MDQSLFYAFVVCFVVFVAVTVEAQLVPGSLTVKPLNYVNYIGRQTNFTCSTNGTASTWKLFRLDGTSCVVFNGATIEPTCVDSRYSVSPQTNGQFNLIIDNTQLTDVGTYRCEDWRTTPGVAPADAAYGLIGSGPTLTQNPSTSCLLQGDSVGLMCELTYNGSVLMPVTMTWTGSGGNVVYSNGTDTGGVYWSTLNITSTNTTISSYQCTVTFGRPTATTIPQTTIPSAYATNTPSYIKSTNSTSYSVQSCPTGINITLTDGTEFTGGNITTDTVIVCVVSGETTGISTAYTWTGTIASNQRTINTGQPYRNQQNITIGQPPGDYTYTCTATSSVCGGPLYCPFQLNKTVTGTSYAAPTVTTPKPPGGGANSTSCADRVECIVPVVVCSVVGGVAIIVLIVVLCFKWSKCPGYKYLQHKHENKPNENTRNGSDNKQLTPQQQTTVNSQFTNDSYQEDTLETQRQGMAYQPTPDLTAGLYAQPTQSPPHGGYLHYSSHQPPQNKPPPTPQKPVSPEGIVYAELAAKPAGSRQPVAAPQSDTVYAQIQSA